MSLFITRPVDSVERATTFYTALGWTLNAEMSDHEWRASRSRPMSTWCSAAARCTPPSAVPMTWSATDDDPFMYQRRFDDPDGHHYSPFWMTPDTDPGA